MKVGEEAVRESRLNAILAWVIIEYTYIWRGLLTDQCPCCYPTTIDHRHVWCLDTCCGCRHLNCQRGCFGYPGVRLCFFSDLETVLIPSSSLISSLVGAKAQWVAVNGKRQWVHLDTWFLSILELFSVFYRLQKFWLENIRIGTWKAKCPDNIAWMGCNCFSCSAGCWLET